MEKIIAIVPKEKFLKVRLCISTITKSAVDVLLIDPEENPNYEEIIKEARAEGTCLFDDSNMEEKFKKSIEEFAKVLEYKNMQHVLDGMDPKKIMDTTPWYDKFMKKGKKNNHWGDKSKFIKKGKGKLY